LSVSETKWLLGGLRYLTVEGCKSGLLVAYKGKKQGGPDLMGFGFFTGETWEMNGGDILVAQSWTN
jgi:hypothetical protein